jgi:hypothetical protein
MKISFDGEIQEYPGSCDEDSILAFAKKMSAPSPSPTWRILIKP